MEAVKKGGIAEAIESIKTEDPNVTNKLREDWNNYISWLDLKGMRGKAELDTNDLGGKVLLSYLLPDLRQPPSLIEQMLSYHLYQLL